MGLCATECLLKYLNFVPKSLKHAVQDFSPFLWIQPDTRQRNHRLPTRRRTDITAYDITGISDRPALLLESSLSMMHYCPQKSSVSFLCHTKGTAAQRPTSPSRFAKVKLAALQSLAGRSCQLAVLIVP